ncbi:hypothetical protein [Flavimaricola marinus]|uniref:Lipoprotein n=1 Tax=Flavimaricola marinus TaxID=1819565 RepID=A0A238LB54_9RHOB|nr:hypothetical protein [Flavimaricola marinus]SMY06783.1 hypothetical protein LOM8899_00913 [Flavimaricola marinus]
MFHSSVLAAAALTALSTAAFAATCPADAPEGYQWLSGYVDEFRADGTVSTWFTDSYAQHPEDIALQGLQAFFDAGGDLAAARALFVQRGGSADAFAVAMACAGVE